MLSITTMIHQLLVSHGLAEAPIEAHTYNPLMNKVRQLGKMKINRKMQHSKNIHWLRNKLRKGTPVPECHHLVAVHLALQRAMINHKVQNNRI